MRSVPSEGSQRLHVRHLGACPKPVRCPLAPIAVSGDSKLGLSLSCRDSELSHLVLFVWPLAFIKDVRPELGHSDFNLTVIDPLPEVFEALRREEMKRHIRMAHVHHVFRSDVKLMLIGKSLPVAVNLRSPCHQRRLIKHT